MKHPLLLATIAAMSISLLHAVEVSQSGDQLSIANAAFSLSYDLKSGTWSATDLVSKTTVFALTRTMKKSISPAS